MIFPECEIFGPKGLLLHCGSYDVIRAHLEREEESATQGVNGGQFGENRFGGKRFRKIVPAAVEARPHVDGRLHRKACGHGRSIHPFGFRAEAG